MAEVADDGGGPVPASGAKGAAQPAVLRGRRRAGTIWAFGVTAAVTLAVLAVSFLAMGESRYNRRLKVGGAWGRRVC